MVREILFRGWNEELKKWVYGCGCGVTKEGVSCITNIEAPNKSRLNDVYANATSVNPESIGQFTGLTDKNGKNIFEGDVCKYGKRHGVIIFNPVLGFFVDGWLDDFREYPERWEVIGNIFENPELSCG